MKDEYLQAKEIRDKYHISHTTLHRWDEAGKVRVVKTPGGNRRYHAADIAAIFHVPAETVVERRTYLYARVSSSQQRDDLERQLQLLRASSKSPASETVVLHDVASGINWNRPGFCTLLDACHAGKVAKVVVTHRDRLCRFAFELVHRIIAKSGAELVVLGHGQEEEDQHADPQQQLAEDLLAITNHFRLQRQEETLERQRAKQAELTKKRERRGIKTTTGSKRRQRQKLHKAQGKRPRLDPQPPRKGKEKEVREEEEEEDDPDSDPEEGNEDEEMPKKLAEKMTKIRLYPTEAQRQKLNKWIGDARWTYNQCVNHWRAHGSCSRKELRQRFLVSEAHKGKDTEWVLETPNAIRDGAIDDFRDAISSNFGKKRIRPGHTFKMRMRAKRYMPQETIRIQNCNTRLDLTRLHTNEGQLLLYPSYDLSYIRSAEEIPKEALEYDTKIIRTRLGQYYLAVPLPLDQQTLPPHLADPLVPERIVSLDPGVRTFQTLYDPSGWVVEWGKGDMQQIFRLLRASDDIQARMTQPTVKARRRKRMKRARLKLLQRIKNMVQDCHHKLAKYLVTNYDHILLPTFETQQMAKRTERKITSTTTRKMLTWSHYRFKMLLNAKAREYPWIRVHDVDEAYTTKCCGACGVLNQSIGGSKRFQCKSCGTALDRDHNGARNILLKNERLLFSEGSPCDMGPADGGAGINVDASTP